MPVVTVSSQYGAGSRDFGRVLAVELGLEYIDQAVLVDAARQLGKTVTEVAEKDERTDSLRVRLGHFLQRALERSAAGGTIDPMLGAGNLELMLSQSYQEMSEGAAPGVVDDRAFLETTSEIIRQLAARGDVLILGRGGQMILRGFPQTTHIQLVADEAVRLGRICEWLSYDEEAGRREMNEFNQGRADFHKKFWKVDVWDPTLYDVVINTSDISYEDATRIAVLAIEAKTRVAAPG